MCDFLWRNTYRCRASCNPKESKYFSSCDISGMFLNASVRRRIKTANLPKLRIYWNLYEMKLVLTFLHWSPFRSSYLNLFFLIWPSFRPSLSLISRAKANIPINESGVSNRKHCVYFGSGVLGRVNWREYVIQVGTSPTYQWKSPIPTLIYRWYTCETVGSYLKWKGVGLTCKMNWIQTPLAFVQ